MAAACRACASSSPNSAAARCTWAARPVLRIQRHPFQQAVHGLADARLGRVARLLTGRQAARRLETHIRQHGQDDGRGLRRPPVAAGRPSTARASQPGNRRCHQLRPLSPCGCTDDSTSRCLARVSATYSTLSSSRARARCSRASACAHAGRHAAFAGQEDEGAGASASPGQSSSTPMVWARCGGASVSSSSTSGASSPLAPCTVSSCTASASAALRRRHAAGLQRAHEGVGRGVAAAVDLQRRGQQRLQIGAHRRRAACARRGRDKTRQHVAVVVDGLAAHRAAAGWTPSAASAAGARPRLAAAGRQSSCCSSSNQGSLRAHAGAAPSCDQAPRRPGRTAATSARAPATGRAPATPARRAARRGPAPRAPRPGRSSRAAGPAMSSCAQLVFHARTGGRACAPAP